MSGPDEVGRMRRAGEVAAVHAERLTRSLGEVLAVDDLDLEVVPGEVHALVGLNGAGKSTLLRLLVGLLEPDAGTVELWGARAWRAPAAVRARIGYVGTSRSYPELTVTESLYWSGRLHGLSGGAARRRADQQIDRLALRSWSSKRVGTLSSGNRQRLAVAAALAHDPDLLVLDEPTNALDPAGVIELRHIILERAERGVAVVVSSHHLDEMARLASVISVLHDGRIVDTLPPDGVDLERQFFRIVQTAASDPDRSRDQQ